jgi:formylglycine-generating enzyme required for sulfatase activity/acetyl esterase/lipase
MIIHGTAARVLAVAGVLTASCLAALPLRLPPTAAREPAALPARADDRAKEVDKKLHEIRTLLGQQKADLGEQRRQLASIQTYLTYAPAVEVRDEDYARARARFRTKLVRAGPAPDRVPPALKPPAGVAEVLYAAEPLRLKGWVNRPADASRKLPAVLFLHGGWAFEASDWEQSRPYRDAGFVVLTPMLRGENGQPGHFTYFYDEVDDVLATAEYLSKQPYVDPERLFVAGHSVGGTMALLAALARPRFRAAASFSGAAFWPGFAESKTLPFDSSDPREIQLRSPIVYAGSFKCPVRLYYGTGEATHFGQMSRRIVALAKSRGLDVEAREIEGDHGSHVRHSLPQSIAFFQDLAPPTDAPWAGATEPLPKSADLNLGGGVRLKVARVEPGKFLMGSPPDEAGRGGDESRREASITKPFAVGVHEVTQAQYRRVMGMSPSRFSPTGDNRERVAGLNTDDFPLENVSWEEAMDFCRVVSLLPAVRDKGWVVDLPTEAEWEYACRAGTATVFHYGNSLSSEQANFNGAPYGGAARGPNLQRTAKVGSYAPTRIPSTSAPSASGTASWRASPWASWATRAPASSPRAAR